MSAPLSPVGRPLDAAETPALVLDLEPFERNVQRMASALEAQGKQWRPHAKAFKCPAIAHRLLKAGAIGVTVAKVSEAEVMADNGVFDILIAHLIVGRSKADRLAALQRRADVKATVDHPEQLADLSEAALAAGVEIGLLVDCDIGMNRTGVRQLEDAVELARRVDRTPGLRFEGLMGYEGHTLAIPDPLEKRAAIQTALGRLIEAKERVERADLPCRIVSSSGTGSYQYAAEHPGITELQAGGGIFACRYYTEVCSVEGHEPAISVRATVVSRPAPDRAILDAGRKSMSDYKILPALLDHPRSEVLGLSAEHAIVQVVPEDNAKLRIGATVRVVPGYSDFTFMLHPQVIAARNGRVEAVWDLLGRGKLQ